jgi:hypothetical protein
VTAVAVELTTAKKRAIAWDKVLLLRRREDEDLVVFFGECLLASAVLALALMAGLGVQLALTPEDVARAMPPKEIALVKERQSLSVAESSHRLASTGNWEVTRNDLGQVVQVRAADPQSVLVGYCRVAATKLCDPVELAMSDPPHAQLRLGIFRGLYDMRAIRIRRDPRTGRWVAGDGKHEIHDYLARSLRMSGDRHLVRNPA